MRNIIVLILTVVLLFPSLTYAQKWKRQRVEYSFGLGATNFLGDLGGRDQEGTNGLMDFEYKATRFAAGLGYRYQVAKDWFVKGNLIYAKVSGDDDLTQEPARHNRQLNFQSHIVELSGQLEYLLIKQKTGHLYSLRGVRGKSWFRFEVYLFAGIGAAWYSPYAKKDGEWYSLKDKHTEGQGLEGGPKQYSGFTAVVPWGIGIKRNLGGGARSRRFSTWSISLELTMRNTFTDYIDDVSTSYYQNPTTGEGTKAVEAAYGPDAGYFADPSGNYYEGQYGEPQQRGDHTDNDAYMLGIISINYKIQKRRRNLPKF